MNFKRFIFFILLILSIICFSCRKSVSPGAGADPADLLPVADDIGGFQKKGSPAIMTDYQTIMDAIDGAAEKYIDYGFIEGVQQMYGNGSIDIDVQVFNHGTRENALGIFQEFYPGTPEVLVQSDEMALVIDHLLLNYALYYRKGNIFMTIVTFEKSDFALNTAKQFCFNIDKKINTD